MRVAADGSGVPALSLAHTRRTCVRWVSDVYLRGAVHAVPADPSSEQVNVDDGSVETRPKDALFVSAKEPFAGPPVKEVLGASGHPSLLASPPPLATAGHVSAG